jgi:general secretion pathway protein A
MSNISSPLEGYDLVELTRYDLSEDPFSSSANPRFVHLGETHKHVYYHAHNLINRRRGLGLITGDVGIGKSSLARLLFYNFVDTESTVISYIPSANWRTKTRAAKEVANSLAELNIETTRSYEDNLDRLSKKIAFTYLETRKNIVLLLDESHLMKKEALELIHELYNFDFDVKAIQVLMFGKPELITLIDKYKDISSRVSVRLSLQPLSYQTALVMINHRLNIAGRKSPLLDDLAYQAIYEASNGVPRDIVGLCGICLDLIIRDNKPIIDEEAALEAIRVRYENI